MRKERVWVVKSYPDLNRFQRRMADPTLKGEFVHLLGYVGIIAKQDGVDILIQAMAYIVNNLDRTDIGCVVIGDGPEHAELVSLATNLGIRDYVRFTGYLFGEELLAALSACDIGIIPDPPNACNNKLSMNKVFEYMALGLPVVHFDLAQARQESGEAALVVCDPSAKGLADKIVELLADEAARLRMSRYGTERAQKEFRMGREKASLLNAYEFLFQAKSCNEANAKKPTPSVPR